MKKEDIHLEDIQRILFGQAPPVFLLEVLLRTAVVYALLLVAIRMLGKRTNAQLTVTEVAIVIMLGAIVSVPMQAPDRGILQGLLVLFCIVAFQRGLTWLMIKSGRVEKLTQGQLSVVVKDGVLQLDVLRKARISRQQIFAIVRNKKVYNLGNVQRLYLEACGTFSLYPFDKPRPGLPVYPPDDYQIIHQQQKNEEDLVACCSCGTVIKKSPSTSCPTCHRHEWIDATL